MRLQNAAIVWGRSWIYNVKYRRVVSTRRYVYAGILAILLLLDHTVCGHLVEKLIHKLIVSAVTFNDAFLALIGHFQQRFELARIASQRDRFQVLVRLKQIIGGVSVAKKTLNITAGYDNGIDSQRRRTRKRSGNRQNGAVIGRHLAHS